MSLREKYLSHKFEIRKRADGLLNKWQLVAASDLGLQEEDDPKPYNVWCVTGVYKTRGQIFRERKGTNG